MAAVIAPARIAGFAGACLVIGICVHGLGAVPERILAEFDLIKAASAADQGNVASAPTDKNGGPASDGYPASWRVVAAEGTPVYRHLEQSMTGWQPVQVGLTVESYAEFDTGSGGLLELFNGNDRMILAPDTTVALPPAPAGSPDITIFQSSGEASYRVRTRRQPTDGLLSRVGRLFLVGARPTGRFDVYTPHLVAAVKGTAFRVSVDEERASVSVTEGVVSVSDVRDGRTAEVRGGKTATAVGSTGGLIVGASSGNIENRNNQGGNSQGDNRQAGNDQADNSQGDNRQGDNSRSGSVNSQ